MRGGAVFYGGCVQEPKIFNKPALTFEEQADRLISRGLEVESKEELTSFLQEVNYYRLRGYYVHAYDSGIDRFHEGTSFAALRDIYRFDEHLRSLLIEYLFKVEGELRTWIAYRIGCVYGPLGHENADNFRVAEYHAIFLQMAEESKKNSDELVKRYFEERYSGRFPIWALVEILSFGDLSRLIANLKPADLEAVCIGVSGHAYTDEFKTAVRALSDLRNACAHGKRIFDKRFRVDAKVRRARRRRYFDEGGSQEDLSFLMGRLFAFQIVIGKKRIWEDFLEAFENLLRDYPSVEPRNLGLNASWKQHLL